MSDFANPPRFPFPRTEAEPAFRAFSARLHIQTALDPFAYAEWLHANLQQLSRNYMDADEPDNNFEIWAKLQFVRATEGVL